LCLLRSPWAIFVEQVRRNDLIAKEVWLENEFFETDGGGSSAEHGVAAGNRRENQGPGAAGTSS
jgi:hypothetical protein